MVVLPGIVVKVVPPLALTCHVYVVFEAAGTVKTIAPLPLQIAVFPVITGDVSGIKLTFIGNISTTSLQPSAVYV
ncbi:hypothetical protein [Flavobacterium gelidilacus]|uniref:hypothetical protein n=1 Tax=Flavobacterium gelidilacus TaxID=206041 RepID=UPI00047DC3F2|nr:hypothetical protein [Flavobacterium gelidilacus]